MQYLTDLSPKDKIWDEKRALTDTVSSLLLEAGYSHLASKVKDCSKFLEFGYQVEPGTGVIDLKLKRARFCRIRFCPICQWRKKLMWVARMLRALPLIQADYPDYPWIFLTLTAKNCPFDELRATFDKMNSSWTKLTKRKCFPGIGYIKSSEVTLGKDGLAHPHFHILMMVPPSYFNGSNYLSQKVWSELWGKSLKVNYDVVVHVKKVRSESLKLKAAGSRGKVKSEPPNIVKGILETLKYCVKEQDLLNKDFLAAVTRELHNTRAVAIGGVFKKYLSEEDPDDLVTEDELEESIKLISVFFGWREHYQRYVKVER